MPGKRAGATPPPNPLSLGGDEPPDLTEQIDDEDAQDIEGVISQIDDDEATVTVKRRDPDDPTGWSYLTAMPARAFSLEKIKLEYGGGEYKALTVDKRKRLIKGVPRLFRIDKAFKPRAPLPVANGAPAASVSPEVAALMAKVDQLAGLVAAQNSTKETLDYALRIAAVMGGGAAKAAMGPDTVFDIFEKGLDFAKRTSGGGDGDDDDGGRSDGDPFDSALKELVRPVARLLETEVSRRARTPGAPPAQPPRLPPGGGEPMPATAPSWLLRLRPYVPQFVGLAREGADPTVYARVVVDLMDRKLSSAEMGGIEEAARGESFVADTMAALPPSCAPHTAWFQKLLEELKAELTAEVEDGEEAPA